jgi:hypothetical protein
MAAVSRPGLEAGGGRQAREREAAHKDATLLLYEDVLLNGRIGSLQSEMLPSSSTIF